MINMALVTLLLSVVASANPLSKDPPLYKNPDRENPVATSIANGLRISTEMGQAHDIASGLFQFPKVDPPKEDVNPAAYLCDKISGFPTIYYTKDGDEVSICAFKDKSFIFGWDLVKAYARQYPK